MKITLTFKNPDAVDQSLEDSGLIRGSKEWNAAQKVISHWVEYGEYVYIEVDTDAKTATVNRVNPLH